MLLYIFRKLIQAILLVSVVLLINFTILRLTPGNPYEAQKYNFAVEVNKGKPLTGPQLSELEQLRSRLGIYLDPYPEAFTRWAGGLVRLDFGNSVITGQPISQPLLQAALNSLWLLLLATVLGVTLGVALGLYSAYKVGRWQDTFIKIVTLLFVALPGWYMLQVFRNIDRQIIELTRDGFSLSPRFNPDALRFWTTFQPILFLGAILMALVWGQTRTQALSVLNQDYIRTARAKGLGSSRIMFWHVFRNSLTPIVSIFAGLLPFVFASQILIERFSGWRGLAQPFLQAASSRDYTYLMAVFTLLVLVCVLCSFLADIAYALIDPKIKEKYQGGVRLAKAKTEASTRRFGGLRPLRVGLVSSSLAVLAVVTVLLLNPFTSSNSPTYANIALNNTATPTKAVGFEVVSLPTDAKILDESTKVGVQEGLIPPSNLVQGNPVPVPPQSNDKESKRILFITKTPVFDMAVNYRKELEGKGWTLSKTFGGSANQSKLNYLFEKDGQYIWLVALYYTEDSYITGIFYRKYRDWYNQIAGRKITIATLTQGYQP